MGMETLNNAARAAGFAMASSDELYADAKPEVNAEATQWRPGEAILLAPPARPHKAGDWFRSVLGFFGRRAPASPA